MSPPRWSRPGRRLHLHRLLNSDVTGEITELKQQPGRNINVSDSGTLVTWLLREGLLDELRLLVFPLVRGSGKRLFAGDGGQIPLQLVSSAALSSGVLHITCRPA